MGSLDLVADVNTDEETPTMATAAQNVAGGELDERYVAMLKFRAELEAWLDSRVRDTGDHVRCYEVTSRMHDGAKCGHLIFFDVVSDSYPDGPIARLTVDTPNW